MIIGIICSQSLVLSKISQELKDCYSSGTEESKIKRLQRFLSNKDFIHVKEGLRFLHKILTPYKFDVTILADRGFKSIYLVL